MSVIVARCLWTISIALWLGGLLIIGAVVAPVTAHFIDAHHAFAADPVHKGALLTGIVGGSLRVFNIICYVCGVFLLMAQAMLWRETPRRVALATLLITLLLLASALGLSLILFPAMDAAQATGQMALFDHLHKRYEAISTDIQFPLLLILTALGAMRDSRPQAQGAGSSTVS